MSDKKCPNCGACKECGAKPPVVVYPNWVYPYWQYPYTVQPNRPYWGTGYQYTTCGTSANQASGPVTQTIN